MKNMVVLSRARMADNVCCMAGELEWMTVPRLEDVPKTSHLDMNKVVFFDREIIERESNEQKEFSFEELFEGLD